MPDGAIVTVGLSRDALWEKDGEPRSIQVGNGGLRVTAGRFSQELNLDDVIIRSQTAEMAVPAPDRLDGAITQLSDAVRICAEFRTGDDHGLPIQPPAVVAAVGLRGEKLANSPQRYVFGSATPDPANWLRARADVVAPSSKLDELERLQGKRPVNVGLTAQC